MYHLILSETFVSLIVKHARSNMSLLLEHAKTLKNLDIFEILITQKTAKMPEEPFCQIGAHI